jgi:hypothetical protein
MANAGLNRRVLTEASSTSQLNRYYAFADQAGVADLPCDGRLWSRFTMAYAVCEAVHVVTCVTSVTPVARRAELSTLSVAAGSVTGLTFDYCASRFWVRLQSP